MIPTQPDSFCSSYGERQIFIALRDGLPDEYTVFHSVRWNIQPSSNTVRSGEADFTIFHPRMGILVIEAKSGGISFENGSWVQERLDTHEKHQMQDPMEQANRSKFTFMDLIKNALPKGEYCWIASAVWFSSIAHVPDQLPPNYHRDIVLTSESIKSPAAAIEKAYSYYGSARRTRLTEVGSHRIIRVLSPAFQAIPGISAQMAEQNHLFYRLTTEQNSLLDYLDEQDNAAIQGGAGTGKTMLAIEKARRLSQNGKVLFLCFNKFLRLFLEENYATENVAYHNLHSLMIEMTKSDYLPEDEDIEKFLTEYREYGWDFNHIIIDEGQDFSANHMAALSTIANETNACFYVFYDKNQTVHQKELPAWLIMAECRLVLRKNCRNTLSIATTSGSPLSVKPYVWDNAVQGVKPRFYVVKNTAGMVKKLQKLIESYTSSGVSLNQITILSPTSVEKSSLRETTHVGKWRLSDNREKDSILFTTAMKFKGLESDVVLFIDIAPEMFRDNLRQNRFYVGCSRAKHYLDFVSALDKQQINDMGTILAGKNLTDGILYVSDLLQVDITFE
ncbi:NERD domain-containing protein [Ruminococcaceae bacterium OttesenSCG-928-I18]|nr:NERD domain-containing protein [Ruminococcaceae bacterium OttesenSCG-928-I18]